MDDVGYDAERKWPVLAIPCFIVLLFVFGWPFTYFHPTGDTDTLTRLIIPAFVWTPALAAIATCWIFRRHVAALPWQVSSAKYAWLGYAIPVAYSLAAYVPLWLTGIAPSQLGVFDTRAQAALGLGPGTATVVSIALVATIGVLRTCVTALGEEIGWRGFLGKRPVLPALLTR